MTPRLISTRATVSASGRLTKGHGSFIRILCGGQATQSLLDLEIWSRGTSARHTLLRTHYMPVTYLHNGNKGSEFGYLWTWLVREAQIRDRGGM